MTTTNPNSASTADIPAFLDAIFGSRKQPIPYLVDGKRIETDDPKFAARHKGHLHVYPACGGVRWFLEMFTDNDTWKKGDHPPTAVLEKGGKYILLFRFETPVPDDDARVIELVEIFEDYEDFGLGSAAGAIPLPGTDGWEMVRLSSTRCYPLEYFAEYVLKIKRQDTLTPVAKIEKKIAALDKSPPEAAVLPIIAGIAKLDNQYEEERLLEQLKGKKAGKIGYLRTALARAKREDGDSGGVELKYDQRGRAIFNYDASFNDDDLVRTVRATLQQKNIPHASNQLKKPTPKLTVMLGRPMKLREDHTGTHFDELDQGAFHAEVCENFLMRNTEGAGANKHVKQDISNICFKTVQDYLPQCPDIVRNPLFDSQFNLIREPGWYVTPEGTPSDKQHNIYLPRNCLRVPEVSANPSREELGRAATLIREDLLGDFPFLTIDRDGTERREPALANAVGMLLTPYVRRAIPGHTPMFFVSKPTPGTGGTLLGRLPMILDGLETTSINLKKGEDEIAKNIVAAIISSRMCMFFDNVKGSNINSDIILVSLTSRMVGDRLLGQSKLIERPNIYLWVATGNNPIILEELNRRIAWINLNAQTADLKNRKFKHQNYESWARDNRGKIVWALLTMIQSWVINGKKPFAGGRSLPSFDKWAEIIGGILENAGLEGFLDTPERIAPDEDQSSANQLVREWAKGLDVELTVKELMDLAMTKSLDAWSGRSDEDKRMRFVQLLENIDGRTFAVEGKRKGVMVRKMLNRDGDVAFTLFEIVKKSGETEAADE